MIKLSKSTITKSDINAVNEALKNEYLGMGIFVKKFENDLKNFFNRNVSCVSSGTAALQLALEACEFPKGSEIIVQSFTYVATFQAIKAAGYVPIACDVTSDLMIDINDAQNKITKKTKAIVPVHYCGDPRRFSDILNFAKKNNLRVIEDAAHAFGSYYKNKIIGSFGDITCFSFDGIKNITSGEGGCIVTNDKKILNYVNNARLLGVINDTKQRYLNRRSWKFEVKNQGWRYHMSNINAALGISQLSRFDLISMKRKNLAIKYYELLKNNNEQIIVHDIDYKKIVPHLFYLILPKDKNREKIRDYLYKNNIETGIHYYPNHLLDFFFNPKTQVPVTDKIFKHIITLPLHLDLKIKDIKLIVQKLKIACRL